MSETLAIGKIETTLSQFMTPVGLLIDEVHLSGGPGQLNLENPEASIATLAVRATVTANSIRVFLENLNPAGLHTFSVRVDSKGIHINAVKTVILPIQTTAMAQLALRNETELEINLISAEAMGAGLKNIVAAQIADLNPIVTADHFPMPIRFTEVIHEDGLVAVIGEIKFPK